MKGTNVQNIPNSFGQGQKSTEEANFNGQLIFNKFSFKSKRFSKRDFKNQGYDVYEMFLK